MKYQLTSYANESPNIKQTLILMYNLSQNCIYEANKHEFILIFMNLF